MARIAHPTASRPGEADFRIDGSRADRAAAPGYEGTMVSRLLPVLAIGLLAGCVTPAPPPLTSDVLAATPSNPLGQTDKPFDFTLKRYPDGKPYQLSSDRGSVVLLDVWASWCEPCRDALPMYVDLLKEYGPRGFKVYAINVDADPREIDAFLAETKVELPILLDPGARFAEAELRVKMMPTSFIVDRRGVVRHVEEGFAEEFLSRYLKEIEQLLQEPAP